MSKVSNNTPIKQSQPGQPAQGQTPAQGQPPKPASKPEAENNLQQAQQAEHRAHEELQRAERSGQQAEIDSKRQGYEQAVRNREAAQTNLDQFKSAEAQQTQAALQGDRFVPQGENPSEWQKMVGELSARDDHNAIFHGMEVHKPATPEEKDQAAAEINKLAEQYKGKSFDELIATVPPQEKAELLAKMGVGFKGAAKSSLHAENRGHQLNKTFAEVMQGLQTPGRSSVDTKMMGGRGHKISMNVAADDKGETQLESFNVKRNKKKGLFSKVADSVKGAWKKYGGTVLTVASFIPGPIGIAARIGGALNGAYNAVKNKDWVGGIASVAGGAASSIATFAGKAVNGTMAAGARVIGRGALVAQAGMAAYENQDAGSILGAAAAVAGVSGSVGALSSGASDRLGQIATWADRGARGVNTVDAVRDGDALGAVASGSGLAAGLVDPDSARGRQLAQVHRLTDAADRVQRSLETGAYQGTDKPLWQAGESPVAGLTKGLGGGSMGASLGSAGAQSAAALGLGAITDAQAQANLSALGQRRVDGQSALLSSDQEGSSLQANLQQLAREQPAGTVNSILQEIADPMQVNQGKHNTCAPASMQYVMAKNHPAEYVRIMNGLLSKEGRVTMANGDVLTRVPGTLGPDKSRERSRTERVFQAAMMDYCNGRVDYDNTNDKHMRSRWKGDFRSREGLNPGAVRKGLEALTGKKVKADVGNPIPNLVQRSNVGERVAQKFSGDMLATLDLPLKGGGSYDHAVTVTEVRDGRVYFKNSQLPSSLARHSLAIPSHRVEDQRNDRGLESMSVEDFAKFAAVAFYVQ